MTSLTDCFYGPGRTARVQLSVQEQKSILHTIALDKNAVEARIREGRIFSHSDFQPTGRYLNKGDILVVTVPGTAAYLEVAIGVHGIYKNLNGGEAVSPKVINLRPGVNRIVSPIDGMVYIQSRFPDTSHIVEISGGHPVPTYIKGITSRKEFNDHLRKWTVSPFIELVGEYVLANIPIRGQATPLLPKDISSFKTISKRAKNFWRDPKTTSGDCIMKSVILIRCLKRDGMSLSK